MEHSCGAILYCISPDGEIGVILGVEKDANDYLPFKGCCKPGETYEQAAIREISEETCGLINVNSIDLNHSFSTKRKQYHIGLVLVDYEFLEKFKKCRESETRAEYKEKREIAFFPLKGIHDLPSVHNIAKSSISFYWDVLNQYGKYKSMIPKDFVRCQGISEDYAKTLRVVHGLHETSSPETTSDDSDEGSVLIRPKHLRFNRKPLGVV